MVCNETKQNVDTNEHTFSENKDIKGSPCDFELNSWCEARSASANTLTVAAANQLLRRKPPQWLCSQQHQPGRITTSRKATGEMNRDRGRNKCGYYDAAKRTTSLREDLLKLCFHMWCCSDVVCLCAGNCVHECVNVWISLCLALHRRHPNKQGSAPIIRSSRRRNKHTQTAGPTCPNKRVADWHNILSSPTQIRFHSFKDPDLGWHRLVIWLGRLLCITIQQLLLLIYLMVKGILNWKSFYCVKKHLYELCPVFLSYSVAALTLAFLYREH